MGDRSDVTDFDESYVLEPKFYVDYKNRFKFGVNFTVFFKFGKNEQKTWNLDKYKRPTHGKIQIFTKIIQNRCIY